MFYSHEILTSPEHGVATIWLVATLGSRSLTRKLNRKTILDVDVPKACDVIINPEAPMALRLQGSLLYGVSRVYNQQCGYTLMDVQTTHDRMKSILKVIHGAGIDPSAGKVKPDQLILPYDPSFLPEINLPGIDLDLSKFDLQHEGPASQGSSLLWTKSPETSQSALPLVSNLQLGIPSDDLLNLGGFGWETDIAGSVQSAGHLGQALGLDFGDEEGILLQTDFEFDEDGNIVELGEPQSTDRGQGTGRRKTETPVSGAAKFSEAHALARDDQEMPTGDEIGDMDMQGIANLQAKDTEQRPPESEVMDDNESDHREIRMPQTRRKVKAMLVDTQIALRNTELAQWNNEYLQNMAVSSKQKQLNKLQTLSKRNAAFWVLGQGIGSVGIGLGTSREPHPLKHFSGEELFALLSGDAKSRGRKRGRPDDNDSERESRRVRAKGDGNQIGLGGLPDEIVMQDDPEIGRHAPSSIRDDQSFQMPWNITASIQSSGHGSSAALPFRGFGSVGGLSSRGLSDPVNAMGQIARLGELGSRLTTASPLTGRGYRFDLDNVPFPGYEGELGDLDLDLYLQSELDPDRHAVSAEGSGAIPMPRASSSQSPQRRLFASGLDQASQNFLDFLNKKTEADSADAADDNERSAGQKVTNETPRRHDSETVFSTLLPPQETSRVVATHALMHVLTLATKGFLTVHQAPYVNERSGDLGAEYRYGEIFLRLSET